MDAAAHFEQGMNLGQQGKLAEALHAFSLAVEAQPAFGEAWRMVSECAGHLGQDDLSVKASAEAMRLMPENAQAWMRHGLALNAVMRDDEAVEAYRRTLELDPTQTGARINLCVSLKKKGSPAEAEQVIRDALAGQVFDTSDGAEEKYNILHWHLALLELASGNLKDGFAHFRARFKGGTNWKRWQGAKPLWRSEDVKGKTILITAEQGHGDMLMMARYLPMLKDRGATVIFQTHPALVRYFTGWSGADRVISMADAVDNLAYDIHAPIFDLPYRLGTGLESIPVNIPYLPVLEPNAATQLPEKTKRKVGIIWSGQAQNPRDKLRSLPLEQLADILAVSDCAFFNLTRERSEGDAKLLTAQGVMDMAPVLHDFMDTAQVIAQLDLVITCDTAAAHLAGGMGKPVWVALPFSPDWRWLYQREDSPWYPTMRLFRQRRRGEWGDVIERMKLALSTQ